MSAQSFACQLFPLTRPPARRGAIWPARRGRPAPPLHGTETSAGHVLAPGAGCRGRRTPLLLPRGPSRTNASTRAHVSACFATTEVNRRRCRARAILLRVSASLTWLGMRAAMIRETCGRAATGSPWCGAAAASLAMAVQICHGLGGVSTPRHPTRIFCNHARRPRLRQQRL